MRVHAIEIPTDEPESDGTLEWDSTTIVLVEVEARGQTGVGYTYADASVGSLIESRLAPLLEGHDPMAPPVTWMRMRSALRNVGQQGAGAMAISAVDIALWDLKAKLLGLPLADAFPGRGPAVPQRRLHVLRARPADRAAARLGRAGVHTREDQGRARPGRRS
jgi:L-alanine-DL-glutamate epimerase-like enolase superfamily enzyme